MNKPHENEIEQEILLKERRIAYWEEYGTMPSSDELDEELWAFSEDAALRRLLV